MTRRLRALSSAGDDSPAGVAVEDAAGAVSEVRVSVMGSLVIEGGEEAARRIARKQSELFH
jgi:hypothetical protein